MTHYSHSDLDIARATGELDDLMTEIRQRGAQTMKYRIQYTTKVYGYVEFDAEPSMLTEDLLPLIAQTLTPPPEDCITILHIDTQETPQ